MLKISCLFFLFLGCLYAKPPIHIVLLGDPHIPGKYLEQKKDVIEQLNQWQDVTMVIALGDLCEKTGSEEEYKSVKTFFDSLHKPLHVINGNHDYMYSDTMDDSGKHHKATPSIQNTKLHSFQRLFNLPKPYYSVIQDNYLLLFLAADDPRYLTAISNDQQSWLKEMLGKHPKMPTIIFFHGPLENTLRSYSKNANATNFIAQPKKAIRTIIEHNPQILLWVSGHTHTTPKEESFDTSTNWYNDHLLNLHNADMNHKTIVTNSLFLEKDHILIRTYNHMEKEWIKTLDRTVLVPNF